MRKDAGPDTTIEQYDFMLPSWSKIETVLGGTRAMRSAGQLYLPQHVSESNERYRERLDKATLLNMTKLTLESWVGRPFSEPVELKEDVPAEIKTLCEDVDTLGNNVNVFARNVFREGLAKAFTHILVDMPRAADDSQRTLANDKRRPYWVHIKPERLFFAEGKVVDGKEQLQEIRFWESVSTRKGFELITVPQIRQLVLTPAGVEVTLYREVKQKSRKTTWQPVEQYLMEIDEIPLVTFYADRQDFHMGTSPIEDLADLNIAHWQSVSDQRACLTVARFPILAMSGATDETQKLVVGPHRWLYMPDTAARAYYVEHSGTALGVGRNEIRDLEEQMGSYGAEFLKKRPNRETATARSLDTAEATSPLQDLTLRYHDTLETALMLTAKWMKMPSGGSVSIKMNFAAPPAGGEGLRALVEAFKTRGISRKAFTDELKRANLLDEDFNADTDRSLLQQETMDLGATL